MMISPNGIGFWRFRYCIIKYPALKAKLKFHRRVVLLQLNKLHSYYVPKKSKEYINPKILLVIQKR